MKKKYFSAKSDLKLGFFSKTLLIIGITLLIISIILYFIPLIEDNKEISGILIAFSILSVGVSIILFFIAAQFAKLAEIAEEIENCEDLKE
jgi:Na+/melibiose symporter-like transporter